MIVEEEGPWEIFAKLRYAIGVRYDEMSNPYGLNVFAKGMICTFCTSVWIAMILVGFYLIIPVETLWFCTVLAVSAAAIIVERIVANGES